MIMKHRIAAPQSDGSLWIVVPVEDAKKQNETDEEFVSRVAKEAGITDFSVMYDDEFPKDRTFRDAWKLNAGVVDHDMAKARVIHRDRIRSQRVTAFVSLDGQWMAATARNDAVEARRIEAQRQTLRDAPADPRIDAAATVEDLKKVWPF